MLQEAACLQDMVYDIWRSQMLQLSVHDITRDVSGAISWMQTLVVQSLAELFICAKPSGRLLVDSKSQESF